MIEKVIIFNATNALNKLQNNCQKNVVEPNPNRKKYLYVISYHDM